MGKTHYRPNIISSQFQQNCNHKQQKTQYFHEKQYARRHIKDIPFNITKFAEETIKPDLSGGKYTTGKAAGSLLIAFLMWSAAAELANAQEHKETKSYKTSHSVYKPVEKVQEFKDVQDISKDKYAESKLFKIKPVKPSGPMPVNIKPILKFSSGETCKPVDPLGDDNNVENNRENYESNPAKFGSTPCIALTKIIIPASTEIWTIYYDNNPVIFDSHEHDLEPIIIHYDGSDFEVALGHHVGYKFYKNPPLVNGNSLEILVGKGGHAMALSEKEFFWPGLEFSTGGDTLSIDACIWGWNMDSEKSPGPDNIDSLGRFKSGPSDHSFGDLISSGDEGLFKLIGLMSEDKENIARDRAKVPGQQIYLGARVFSYKELLEVKELYAKIKISGDAKFRVEDTILNKYTGERSPAFEELPLSHFESSGDTKGIAQQVISKFSNNRYAVEALKDTKYAITIDAVVGSQINELSASEIEIKAGQVHYISADDFSKSDSLKIGVDTNKDGTPDYSYGEAGALQNSDKYILPAAIGTSTAIGIAAYLFYRRRRGKPAMYDTKPHMQKPKAQKGMF